MGTKSFHNCQSEKGSRIRPRKNKGQKLLSHTFIQEKEKKTRNQSRNKKVKSENIRIKKKAKHGRDISQSMPSKENHFYPK